LSPLWASRDLIAAAQENRQVQAELDAWSPSSLHTNDQDFMGHPVYQAAEEFLTAWEKGNYGRMAALLARNSLGYDENLGKAAGDIRGQYELVELAGFDILELDFVAASICMVRGRLTCDGESRPAWFRWIYEDANGAPVVDGGEGLWKVYARALFCDSRDRTIFGCRRYAASTGSRSGCTTTRRTTKVAPISMLVMARQRRPSTSRT
jgi:hypothetical protein